MSALLRPSLHVLSLFLVMCTGLLLAHSVNTVLSLLLLPLPSPEAILAVTNTYEVPRQEVDSALANAHQLAMQARVVPSFVKGAPQGFKLFAIRPDSFFTRIGLRNGDTLRRLNGFMLDSPDNALEAYKRLREASHIELEVVRDGQPVLQTYRIR